MIESNKWRAWSLVATAGLVVLIGGLLIQHARHGWPFSLHHGMAAPAAAADPHAGHAPAGAPAASAHPRAPVELDPSRLSSIGVRTEKPRTETIARPIRAVATIVPDEARVSHVHTRVAGWIEQLHVSTTGQSVRAGQALAGIFSQELLAAQNEYLAARRLAAQGPASAVGQGARARLGVLGMTEAEIRAIESSGEARRLVTITAPRGGAVVHRGVNVGTAVDPSTELLTIADLSRVWVLAEIPEHDIPNVEVGTLATLSFPASGKPAVEAKVEFLYPTLSERTRTLRVRFAIANPSGSLRPGLYGTAELEVAPRSALTVPRDAVVDTGEAQHVFVVQGEGRMAPHPVELGARLEDRVEVIDGLSASDEVVSSGVFLIDSESRLRASGGGTGHAHGSTAEPTGQEKREPPKQGSPKSQRAVKPSGHEGLKVAEPTGHEGHGAAP
jgi:Cu(I)/Ag(I) efflux system membrane fusion protein